MKHIKYFLVITLLIASIGCRTNYSQEKKETETPSEPTIEIEKCTYIEIPSLFIIYRNEETILHVGISGLPAEEVEVQLSQGEIISLDGGVCKLIVKEGDFTKVVLIDSNTGYEHGMRRFEIIDR